MANKINGVINILFPPKKYVAFVSQLLYAPHLTFATLLLENLLK